MREMSVSIYVTMELSEAKMKEMSYLSVPLLLSVFPFLLPPPTPSPFSLNVILSFIYQIYFIAN